jgi:cell wall-associated NlpC family hydrolase
MSFGTGRGGANSEVLVIKRNRKEVKGQKVNERKKQNKLFSGVLAYLGVTTGMLAAAPAVSAQEVQAEADLAAVGVAKAVTDYARDNIAAPIAVSAAVSGYEGKQRIAPVGATAVAADIVGVEQKVRELEAQEAEAEAARLAVQAAEEAARIEREEASPFHNIAIAQVRTFVNVRSEPTISDNVVGKIYNEQGGSILEVVENEEGVWYRVKSGDMEGYVVARYFVTGTAAEGIGRDAGYMVGRVNTEKLNVRSDATVESDIVTQVDELDKIQVLEEGDEFTKVSDGENVGYVKNDYIDFEVDVTPGISLAEERWIEEEAARIQSERKQALLKAKSEAEITAALARIDAEHQAAEAENKLRKAQEAAEEAARIAEEAARVEAEAAEKARLQAEEAEAARRQEEQAAEEEARRQRDAKAAEAAADEARRLKEAEALEAAEEARRQAEQAEEARLREEEAAEEARRLAEEAEEARREAEEQAEKERRNAELAAKLQEEAEAAKRAAEEEAQRQQRLEEKARQEAEEEEARRIAEEEARIRAEEEAKQKAKAEARRRAEEEARRREEEEEAARRAAEKEAQKKAEKEEEQSSRSSSNYSDTDQLRKDIAAYAKTFVGNLPYVWGGTSLKTGADCSGFVQSIFKKFGVSLPRSSDEQGRTGRKIKASQLQPGDLVHYDGHIAIYIGNGKVCHASSKKTGVKISDYDYRTVCCCRNVLD